MRAARITAVVITAASLLYAEDFTLSQSGVGPLKVHTTLTYEGKGERLVATASNESGVAIPYAKFCVTAETKGCLFEMWTTEQWEPGKMLTFDVTTTRHVPNLSHQVKIVELNAASPQVPERMPTSGASVVPANQPAAGQEVLINETIIKLVKAGLSDDIILGMVNSRPGEYSTGVDAIIALKGAGVSDAVITAIMNRGSPNKTAQSPPISPIDPTGLAGRKELTVRIIDRQNHETHYTYFLPGYSTAYANTNVNCFGSDNTANCSGSTRVTQTNMPARSGSFDVQGATFALQLPDGRVVVVNCDSKFAERFLGPAGNHRSCRTPLIDEIQAEFSGANAKLKWPVSIDGKKMESETYILQKGRYQIEVMTNLDKVPATGALIVVSWPKVKDGLGFPARAFAILP